MLDVLRGERNGMLEQIDHYKVLMSEVSKQNHSIKEQLKKERNSEAMNQLKKLIDEYKQSYAMQQDKNRLLETELSELTVENEVA